MIEKYFEIKFFLEYVAPLAFLALVAVVWLIGFVYLKLCDLREKRNNRKED